MRYRSRAPTRTPGISLNMSSTLLPDIHQQKLVRHPSFSLVSLLAEPFSYRVAPAARESCGVYTCSIACAHVHPAYPHTPASVLTSTGKSVKKYSQHQSLHVQSVPSGSLGPTHRTLPNTTLRVLERTWNIYFTTNQQQQVHPAGIPMIYPSILPRNPHGNPRNYAQLRVKFFI